MVPHGGKMQPGVRAVSQQKPKQSRHWYAQTVLLDAAPRWPVGSAAPAASAASGTKTKNVVLSVGQPWCQAEEGKPYSSGARVPRPPHLRGGGWRRSAELPKRGHRRCRDPTTTRLLEVSNCFRSNAVRISQWGCNRLSGNSSSSEQQQLSGPNQWQQQQQQRAAAAHSSMQQQHQLTAACRTRSQHLAVSVMTANSVRLERKSEQLAA